MTARRQRRSDADGDGVDDADEPAILGAINFGSPTPFNAQNGIAIGDASLGRRSTP